MQINDEQIKTDVIIIGAGPAGLFSIFECGMLGLKMQVVESLDFIGGQCRALYPEKPIYDIPGFPEILADDLIKSLEKQAEPFKPVYHLGEQIVEISRSDDGMFTLKTSKDKTLYARAIILAGGCGSFGPNRPPMENIEEFEGSSILYMVGNRMQFKDKTIVIAGGGDSAVDWAISLSEVARKIYVVHRRDKFRCMHSSYVKMTEAENVELVIPYQLHSVSGSQGQLTQVIVEDLDGHKRMIDADYLLPFFGLKMELGPILNWGLNFTKSHIAVRPDTMETNIPGFYAIGDISTYPGKLKLIVTGFAEAALAAHNSFHSVFPDKPLHFEYSTTKGIK